MTFFPASVCHVFGDATQNALFRSLQLKSSGEHSDPEFAVEVPGEHSDPEFAVEVPGEHSDPELAVEVRRGTLWSWACGGGPAGNTAISSLQLKSGGGRRRKEEGGRQAAIKSNNPHLTGEGKRHVEFETVCHNTFCHSFVAQCSARRDKYEDLHLFWAERRIKATLKKHGFATQTVVEIDNIQETWKSVIFLIA